MKQSIAMSLVLVLTAAVPAAAHAQSGDMKGMDMQGMDMKGMDMDKKPASGTVHKAIGVVKKMDAKAGTVTLAHEPVKSMNWPAMNMTFQVKDRKLLDKLAVDKKAQVEFVQQGKEYVITAVK